LFVNFKNKIKIIIKDGKPVTYYKFGPQKAQSIAIEQSLNKLNKCIRIAYMKMTTPKWKDFKGLKLKWKHRIRLNNMIWRAYFMECNAMG
jgi:MAX-like protein X